MKKQSGAFSVFVAGLVAALLIQLVNQSHVFLSTEKQTRWNAAKAKCEARYSRPSRLVTDERVYNPRTSIYGKNATSKLIKNALLLDGDGKLTSDLHDIFITNGLIKSIHKSGYSDQAQTLRTTTNHTLEVIDAKGHIASPGLVEMHSHIGICSQPELKGTNDMFELMSPATPFTRVIDAFNIGDPAIKLNAMGGVTSSLVLPSANIISGEGYVFKMAVPESRSVEQMLIQYDPEHPFQSPNAGKRHRWMKMACGENPKKRFMNRPEAPKSRMGLGYLFREYMDRAIRLKEEQDEWCKAVEQMNIPDTQFPHEVDIEILVGLLRGQVSSNAHCYETFDIETLLRHSKEYNFEVDALHHALDAYLIPDILKSLPWNITIATFATLWGFKKEAYQASLFSPEILNAHDLNVVLTTDHPALPGHTLVYQAQIAHNYGLPEDVAFASITGKPAGALNLDDRIGYLRVGYDADVVIWDKHPLQAGATPLKMLIDGEKVLDLAIEDGTFEQSAPKSRYTSKSIGADEEHLNEKSYLIKGISSSFLTTLEKSAESLFELLVEDGEVSCFSPSCPTTNREVIVIELEQGTIIPGITAVSEAHGLVDIPSEPSTGDGDIREYAGGSFRDSSSVMFAHNGLHLGSEHLVRALNSGVTRIITPPFRSEGQKFITGVSVAFKSSSSDLSSVLKDEVALHITLGDAGKEPSLPTISSQIAALKSLLIENKDLDNVYGRVARGELALAAHVNSKDIMIQLLRLQNELTFNLLIIGGLEAHLVSQTLVSQNVPVIVKGWRCQRKYWDERRCLTGVGGEETIISNLISAGVKVGLAYTEDLDIRMALDQIASATKASGISAKKAIEMASTNVMEIFGIEDSGKLSFVVLEGSPVEYGSRVAAIIEDGSLIRKSPQPEPAYDLYH